ncbi:MAG: protein kinase family protein [Mailhella sp.]|nr:protein kinase family protein [Mailhella sp.]
MLKIERVKESNWRESYFSFRPEELYDSYAFRITLFGKTYRVKFSKKFNYFLIAYKSIRAEKELRLQKLLIGKLAQVVLEQALVKEGVLVSNLEILLTEGKGPYFNFKGRLENRPVFIKTNIYSTPPSKTSSASYLKGEYENGLLFSSGCPYCLKPITYLELPQFEVLVTPLVENVQSLHDCMRSAEGPDDTYISQLQEVRNYMRENRLVHGDLHGSNILIGTLGNGERQLYIIDFASAKQFTDDSIFKSHEYKTDEINFNRYFNTVQKAKSH